MDGSFSKLIILYKMIIALLLEKATVNLKFNFQVDARVIFSELIIVLMLCTDDASFSLRAFLTDRED